MVLCLVSLQAKATVSPQCRSKSFLVLPKGRYDLQNCQPKNCKALVKYISSLDYMDSQSIKMKYQKAIN